MLAPDTEKSPTDPDPVTAMMFTRILVLSLVAATPVWAQTITTKMHLASSN